MVLGVNRTYLYGIHILRTSGFNLRWQDISQWISSMSLQTCYACNYPFLLCLPLHKGTDVLLPISKVDTSELKKYARFLVPFPEWFSNDHMEHNINQSSAIEPSQIDTNTIQMLYKNINTTVQHIPFFNRTITEWSNGRILGVMYQLVSMSITSLLFLLFLFFTRGLTFK